MAMTQKERDDRRREKEKKTGAEDLRLKALQGEKQMVRDIMEWTEDTEQASAIMLCIRHLHASGPEGARLASEALKARHKLELSDSWRARFDSESRRELMRDSGDEVLSPETVIQSSQ